MLPFKVVKMARIEEVTRALQVEADKVRELRGDLESVRNEEGKELDGEAPDEERVELVIMVEEMKEELREMMEAVGPKIKEIEEIEGA
jgi:hypothetical protein